MDENVFVVPDDANHVILRVHCDHDVLDTVAEPERGLYEVLADPRNPLHIEPTPHRNLGEDRPARCLHDRGAQRAVNFEDFCQDAFGMNVLGLGNWDGAFLPDVRSG